MTRLYCPKESIIGDYIIINQRKQIHYLSSVLRLKIDDDVFVFDGQGNRYLSQIQGLSKKEVRLIIKEKSKIKSQPKSSLTIACALPKQKNMFDDLIDKLSQLGVDEIIPMITDRVILRWDSRQKQRHEQRWHEIAKQACAQSDRSVLPVIEPIKQINQILISSQSYDLKLIPTLMGQRRNLRELICGTLAKSILVLIGPEGDFTPQELAQAKKSGFIPLFLGEQVLRVDTAALAVAAFFRLSEATT